MRTDLNLPSQVTLTISNLSFQYHRRPEPSIRNINLEILPGKVTFIAGSSGCGKTTLMRCINGLAPRIYQGELTGSVLINEKPVDSYSMIQLSQLVGTLLQDPERQIVASHVLNEVGFGLENLAVPRQRILHRVEETLEFLGISHLRDRETFQLSGGEKQKIALAGVLVMQPKILLLDEPLASLDPVSARGALEVFRKLADTGYSVIIVEHRVEDVLTIHPEHVVYMQGGEIAYQGDAAGLVEYADPKRVKLPAEVVVRRASESEQTGQLVHRPILPEKEELIRFANVSFRYREDMPVIFKNVNLSVNKGDVIAILGPNGAGKTTLVKQAMGLLTPTTGDVYLEGKSTRALSIGQVARTIGYVFQSPTQMLFAPTVQEELEFGPKNLQHPVEQIKTDVDHALEVIHLEDERTSAPLALSFGQQKRVSIGSILSMRSKILMMDEPTAGQDYWNYMSFMDSIMEMPDFDAIIFITHDLDLALVYANRIILLKDGTIAANGKSEEILADLPLLKSARVVPTSLLRLNLERLPLTESFRRAEALVGYPSSI